MLKFAVAALLATTTLAFEHVEAFTNDYNPWSLIHLHQIFDVKSFYNIDFGYKAAYDTAMPTSDIIQDTFSVKMFSYARLGLRTTFFDKY